MRVDQPDVSTMPPIRVFRIIVFVFLVGLFVVGISGDTKCIAKNGKCQYDHLSCNGGYYISYLCKGPRNRRCCVSSPKGDSKCRAKNGKCQYDNTGCHGGYYISDLCDGPRDRRCCVSRSIVW